MPSTHQTLISQKYNPALPKTKLERRTQNVFSVVSQLLQIFRRFRYFTMHIFSTIHHSCRKHVWPMKCSNRRLGASHLYGGIMFHLLSPLSPHVQRVGPSASIFTVQKVLRPQYVMLVFIRSSQYRRGGVTKCRGIRSFRSGVMLKHSFKKSCPLVEK